MEFLDLRVVYMVCCKHCTLYQSVEQKISSFFLLRIVIWLVQRRAWIGRRASFSYNFRYFIWFDTICWRCSSCVPRWPKCASLYSLCLSCTLFSSYISLILSIRIVHHRFGSLFFNLYCHLVKQNVFSVKRFNLS